MCGELSIAYVRADSLPQRRKVPRGVSYLIYLINTPQFSWLILRQALAKDPSGQRPNYSEGKKKITIITLSSLKSPFLPLW